MASASCRSSPSRRRTWWVAVLSVIVPAVVVGRAPASTSALQRVEGPAASLRRLQSLNILARPRRKKNVLILMSDTGGGHRASALALKAAMEELYPNRLNVTVVDMYARCAALPWRWIPHMYRRLAKRPLQWRFTVLFFADLKPVRRFCEWWIHYATSSGLRQCLVAHEPDMVVSMHAMTTIYPISALRRLGGGRRRVPVVTVVTDLTTVHPAWFDKGVDMCFVASEEAARLARSRGLRPGQIRIYGLPIHPMFGRRQPSRQALRRRIGAMANRPAVLLVGGGDGVGGIGRLADVVAHELGARFPDKAQLVVVCGKNAAVRAGTARMGASMPGPYAAHLPGSRCAASSRRNAGLACTSS